MKKILIAGAATAAAAVGATALVATPAHADVERRGTCAGATYELSVDRERGGYDVDADLDALQATVDEIVREARRSEREGLDPRTDGVPVLAERVRHWVPLAEDLGRPFELDLATSGPLLRTSRADLEALVDVLLDNVFTHTADDDAVRVTLTAYVDRVELVVEDAGPGLPTDLDPTGRGASGAGSTGLGLAIASRTAEDSGGTLSVGVSDMGGARVAVTLRTA